MFFKIGVLKNFIRKYLCWSLWLEKKAQVVISSHNQVHNVLRLLDVLTYLPFTTSEIKGKYYLYTLYVRVASQVAERLGKLGNIKKVSKLRRMIAQRPVPPAKMKALSMPEENS